MDSIGFIGAGNMAEALISGIIESRLVKPEMVVASDIRNERLEELRDRYGIRTTDNNTDLTRECQTIVLSVKPQVLFPVLEGLAGTLRDDTLVVSIVAGVTCAALQARLGDVTIIRTMPNTPAMVREGATGIFNLNASVAQLDQTVRLFGAVGLTVVVESEDLIDSVIAASGSGPAYFFRIMEEMIRAGIDLGLKPEDAARLVCQTAKGAGVLAVQAGSTGESPGSLRKKVSSPGGTTLAALAVMDEGGISEIMNEAMTRARDRSREISEELAGN